MRASGTPIVHAGEKRLTDSLVYDIARLIGSPFAFDVAGLENIQSPGPAIYIANHLGPIGPIAVILSVPIRFYPWVMADMVDFDRAPHYLFDDFVHPVLHLNGRAGMLFSTLLSKISVRLLNNLKGIPIDRFGGWMTEGFRLSLRLLQEGKNLLIFPEDMLLRLDPETQMRHFMPGFATLCSLFQAEAEVMLPVYPMVVHAASELVSIGKPLFYRPQGTHKQSVNIFCQQVEDKVRKIYLDLNKNHEEIYS
jgi:hypothetical protein